MYQLWPLREVTSPPAEERAIWPGQRPQCVPCPWSQGTCASCLSCLRVYSVPPAAPCMPGLVCVTYWAVCSVQEQSRSLDSAWGWGELTKPQQAFLKNGVTHPRLGREQLVLFTVPTLLLAWSV